MSTKLTSNPGAVVRRLSIVALGGALLLAPGCTYSAGKLLFMMGVGQGRMVPAEFTLTKGPLLIFIDDYHEQLTWPLASRYLFDELSQELLRQEAATKIIPLATLDSFRQSHTDFSKLSVREIGELVNAEQVLWIEVQDFLAEEQVFDATDAAYFHVTLKVLNPKETKRRSRVRLWPVSPYGHLVTVSISGARVAELETRTKISKELASQLAVEIAKRFYDYRLGDFEKER